MRSLRLAARATWLLVALALAVWQLPDGESVARADRTWSAATYALAHPVARQSQWRASEAPPATPGPHLAFGATGWPSPIVAQHAMARTAQPRGAADAPLGYNQRGPHRPYDSAAPPRS